MKQYLPLALAGFWLAAVAGGLVYLAAYENTPGRTAQVPGQWPAGSALTRAADRPTLIFFAHPRCPCTRASIGELAILMAQAGEGVNATVIFFKPGGDEAEWPASGLWQSAAAIPGVRVRADHAGREAGLFHAQTSGHTVLYGVNGELLFSGGITSARGHAGDNEGRGGIVKLLRHEVPGSAQTPVFGCSLFNPAAPQTAALP